MDSPTADTSTHPAVLDPESNESRSKSHTNGSVASDDDFSFETKGMDDNDLARKGIVLMLENDWKQSQALFDKYKGQSSIMAYGSAFVTFTKSLLSQEDDQIESAKSVLEDVEKRCSKDTGLSKLAKKVKGKQVPVTSKEDKWMNEIILADALFYRAVATFMGQELPSYIKGGWLMRKAWKIYERNYKEISVLYQKSLDEGDVHLPSKNKTDGASSDGEVLTVESLKRMFSAVCYGYGLFQLILSMIPDKVLKLIEFLGFGANKETGLKCLSFCSESSDMRGPLAMLAVLWYHTIMKPVFSNNNELSKEDLEETSKLLIKFEPMYSKTWAIMYFKGRFCRLKKDVNGALDLYSCAHSMAEQSRETQLAILFEIAWCNLLKLNYSECKDAFGQLAEETKWSKSFNKYMQALCTGAMGDETGANAMAQEALKLVKKKSSPIEAFVHRRTTAFKKFKLTKLTSELHIVELLYLWNNLPQCSDDMLQKILEVCSAQEDRQVFHIRSLVEGTVHKQLGDEEFGMQCLKECLALHDGMKYDYHIAAHALFEQGVVWIKEEDTKKKGKQCLVKAKDGFKEYDFENRLNIRIKASLKEC